MRAVVKGSLATLDRDSGAPYVSMVNFAADHDGSPLLLLSDLARHTANLRADARASLLLDQTDPQGDPATGARLTLMGRMARTDDPAVRQRYLARLPSAALYADFGDFAFWRLESTAGTLLVDLAAYTAYRARNFVSVPVTKPHPTSWSPAPSLGKLQSSTLQSSTMPRLRYPFRFWLNSRGACGAPKKRAATQQRIERRCSQKIGKICASVDHP